MLLLLVNFNMTGRDNKSKVFAYIFGIIAGIVIIYISISSILPQKNLDSDRQTKDNKSITVIAYGNNSFGQLGKPSYELNTNLNHIEVSEDVDQIAVGRNFAVLLYKSGNVSTWGGNEWGQLGYETPGTYYHPELLQIPNISGITKVDAKNNHTLLLKDDGRVFSFGSNFSGQLGTGDNSDSSKPILVEGINDAIDIAAGYKFSLALSKDGFVWGWGATCDNTARAEADVWWKSITSGMSKIDGGYYDATADSLVQYDKTEYCVNEDIVGILSRTPVKIKNLEGITNVTAGYGHALALKNDGSVWSFGCNTFQQLGRVTSKKEENQNAQKIVGLPKIRLVSAGYRHSLAISVDGNVWGWGLNNHGQLGTKTDKELEIIPVKIPIDNVNTITAGFDYSIALKNDGTVWGWGMNRDKFLIDSEDEFIAEPVELKNFKNVKLVAASGENITALSN